MRSAKLATCCLTRIVVLVLYITTLQPTSLLATLNAGVEKYVITRRSRNDSDVFRVVYKTGFECPSDVCASASAWAESGTQCGCSCKHETPTFLPELGSCGDTASIKKSLFGVCPHFFEWGFFLQSLNLANKGQVNIVSDDSYQSCQVVPGGAAYYDYQLENKWVGINTDMFSVEKKESNQVFKWADTTEKNLLGRIVRVNVTCNFSASGSGPAKTACLIFKTSGQVTLTPSTEVKTTPYIFPKTTVTVFTELTENFTKTTSPTESTISTGVSLEKDVATNIVMIGFAVGCALVFLLLLIVLAVLFKQGKLKKCSQQETMSAVGNPALTEIYDEIQMERLTEGLSNSSEQDNQSTYQELVNIRDESDYLLPLEERGPADFKSTYQGLVDISDQSGYLLPVEETRPADCQTHAAIYREPSSPKLLTDQSGYLIPVEETRPANCQSDNQTIGKSAIYSESQSPQPPRDKQTNEDYQYDYAEPDGVIVLATIRTSLENLDSLRDPDSEPGEESYVETREADILSSPISTTVEGPNLPRSPGASSKGPSQDNNCDDSLQADGYIEFLPECDDSLQAEYYIDVLPDSESGT